MLATLGMQNNIVKCDTEAKPIVTLYQMSEKAYAAVNLQVWAVPGKSGKLAVKPLQTTLKQPGQVVSKKECLLFKAGKEGATACY